MVDDIIQEALEKGVKLHAAGQLDLAEQLYEAALNLKPNHPEANHPCKSCKICNRGDVIAAKLN